MYKIGCEVIVISGGLPTAIRTIEKVTSKSITDNRGRVWRKNGTDRFNILDEFYIVPATKRLKETVKGLRELAIEIAGEMEVIDDKDCNYPAN